MKNRILIWNNDALTFPRETTMRRKRHRGRHAWRDPQPRRFPWLRMLPRKSSIIINSIVKSVERACTFPTRIRFYDRYTYGRSVCCSQVSTVCVVWGVMGLNSETWLCPEMSGASEPNSGDLSRIQWAHRSGKDMPTWKFVNSIKSLFLTESY